ncbi:NTPase [Colletotrichum higginsianum]|nr:NTPase [Colletotrichum higginsianum]
MATKTTSIVVASKNPTKIRAAQLGFESALPGGSYDMRGHTVGSARPALSDEETLRGALNRARGAQEIETEADYWVGIEGGIDMADRQEGGPIMNFAWIVVLDRHGRVGKARTAAYYLAEETAACLRRGMELGDADNLVFGQTNTRSGKGSVGLLTDDVIDRTEYYRHAVILALIPFKNKTLTFV